LVLDGSHATAFIVTTRSMEHVLHVTAGEVTWSKESSPARWRTLRAGSNCTLSHGDGLVTVDYHAVDAANSSTASYMFHVPQLGAAEPAAQTGWSTPGDVAAAVMRIRWEEAIVPVMRIRHGAAFNAYVTEYRQRARECYLSERDAGAAEDSASRQDGLVPSEADMHFVAHGPTFTAFMQQREGELRARPGQGSAPGHATAAGAECLPVAWCILILRELHNAGLRHWQAGRKQFRQLIEEENRTCDGTQPERQYVGVLPERRQWLSWSIRVHIGGRLARAGARGFAELHEELVMEILAYLERDDVAAGSVCVTWRQLWGQLQPRAGDHVYIGHGAVVRAYLPGQFLGEGGHEGQPVTVRAIPTAAECRQDANAVWTLSAELVPGHVDLRMADAGVRGTLRVRLGAIVLRRGGESWWYERRQLAVEADLAAIGAAGIESLRRRNTAVYGPAMAAFYARFGTEPEPEPASWDGGGFIGVDVAEAWAARWSELGVPAIGAEWLLYHAMYDAGELVVEAAREAIGSAAALSGLDGVRWSEAGRKLLRAVQERERELRVLAVLQAIQQAQAATSCDTDVTLQGAWTRAVAAVVCFAGCCAVLLAVGGAVALAVVTVRWWRQRRQR
jgi:hypothetical protein